MNRDPTYGFSGKKIAVIGNGSSGIQIVPAVQKTAATVVNYIRKPTWVSANFAGQYTPEGSNFHYSAEQKEEWAESPEKFLAYRKQLEHSYVLSVPQRWDECSSRQSQGQLRVHGHAEGLPREPDVPRHVYWPHDCPSG